MLIDEIICLDNFDNRNMVFTKNNNKIKIGNRTVYDNILEYKNADEEEILKSFDKSVDKALALKKALGHYAVDWDEKTKKVVRIEAKDLPEYKNKDEQYAPYP
jgi:uncharacterized protein YhaN